MIILDTSRSLVAVLAAAKTTNDMDFVSSYADHDASFVSGVSDGTTNGTTEVELVAAPGSGKRMVKGLNIYNTDTAACTITIRIKNGATYRTITKVTLAAGETLTYIDGYWQQFTTQYKEYGFLTMSADQTTGIAATNPIKFNTISGDLQFNAATYSATLRANHTYKLVASCDCTFFDATGSAQYRWYNVTASGYIVTSKAAYLLPVSQTYSASIQPITYAILTPTVDSSVQCRLTSSTMLSQITAVFSFAFIETL